MLNHIDDWREKINKHKYYADDCKFWIVYYSKSKYWMNKSSYELDREKCILEYDKLIYERSNNGFGIVDTYHDKLMHHIIQYKIYDSQIEQCKDMIYDKIYDTKYICKDIMGIINEYI
jgi:hypothetical protein